MHLAPREKDKILLHQVGFLAQKRLARGVRLNVAEATALIGESTRETHDDPHPVAERTSHLPQHVYSKSGFEMASTA
jgi:urease gamma subunit